MENNNISFSPLTESGTIISLNNQEIAYVDLNEVIIFIEKSIIPNKYMNQKIRKATNKFFEENKEVKEKLLVNSNFDITKETKNNDGEELNYIYYTNNKKDIIAQINNYKLELKTKYLPFKILYQLENDLIKLCKSQNINNNDYLYLKKSDTTKLYLYGKIVGLDQKDLDNIFKLTQDYHSTLCLVSAIEHGLNKEEIDYVYKLILTNLESSIIYGVIQCFSSDVNIELIKFFGDLLANNKIHKITFEKTILTLTTNPHIFNLEKIKESYKNMNTEDFKKALINNLKKVSKEENDYGLILNKDINFVLENTTQDEIVEKHKHRSLFKIFNFKKQKKNDQDIEITKIKDFMYQLIDISKINENGCTVNYDGQNLGKISVYQEIILDHKLLEKYYYHQFKDELIEYLNFFIGENIQTFKQYEELKNKNTIFEKELENNGIKYFLVNKQDKNNKTMVAEITSKRELQLINKVLSKEYKKQIYSDLLFSDEIKYPYLVNPFKYHDEIKELMVNILVDQKSIEYLKIIAHPHLEITQAKQLYNEIKNCDHHEILKEKQREFLFQNQKKPIKRIMNLEELYNNLIQKIAMLIPLTEAETNNNQDINSYTFSVEDLFNIFKQDLSSYRQSEVKNRIINFLNKHKMINKEKDNQ